MKFWCGTAFMSSPDLPKVAQMLDQAGYHGAVMSDHVIFPKELKTPYPYSPDGRPVWDAATSWPDSWVLIGAMAAVTERLHLSNSVYIAPARPLLQVAKQVATASVLSGGRVGLGLAAGWMREEFELLGQDFDNRGPRLNEMIQALRELWKGGWVEWHGEFYDVPSLMLEPHPPAAVPIYGGGHSDAAIERVARHCDGWIGNWYTWDQAVHYIGKVKQRLEVHGREDEPFEIVISLADPPSVDLYRRAEEELGVTGLMCTPWAGMDEDQGVGPERYRPHIERFAEEIVTKLKD